MTKTTVANWPEFQKRWSGATNFLMSGECVPFAFDFPPLPQVVEEIRRDPEARITPGAKGAKMDMTDVAAQFRALPIEQAMRSPFGLAHFRLSAFDAPGRILHGFKEKVLDPWQAALKREGFTFDRCYPIVFISGIQCATNYHMDFSHVVAWQVYGTKRFCGLKDPNRFASRDVRLSYKAGDIERPSSLTAADTLCYDMKPGDVLWNALLTPHWVEAANEVAMSVNISHGGLRLNGKLCPHEQELADYRAQNPQSAPKAVAGTY